MLYSGAFAKYMRKYGRFISYVPLSMVFTRKKDPQPSLAQFSSLIDAMLLPSESMKTPPLIDLFGLNPNRTTCTENNTIRGIIWGSRVVSMDISEGKGKGEGVVMRHVISELVQWNKECGSTTKLRGSFTLLRDACVIITAR